MIFSCRIFSVLVFVAIVPFTWAQRGEFMTSEEFLAQAFVDSAPETGTLWLQKKHKQVAESILNHKMTALRVRYWHQDSRSAWVLDEVGKDLPITIGVVVENDLVINAEVLVFRESRGGEVRHPFFTEQFKNLSLAPKEGGSDVGGDGGSISASELIVRPQLSSSVDGITGATLSVRAMKKVVTLALFFHQISEISTSHKGRYAEAQSPL